MSVVGGDRIDRRQCREVDVRRIRGRSHGRRSAVGRRRRARRVRACGRRTARPRRSLRRLAGLALAPRPARQEILGLAHASSSFRDAGGRARQRFRIGALLLALDERLLDMVLGDEGVNHLADRFGHRHRLDQIGAALGEGFAFARIGGDGDDLVGRLGAGRPQHHPQAGAAGREIVAILRAYRCDRGRPRRGRRRSASPRRHPRAPSRAVPPARPAAPPPAATHSRPTGFSPCGARPRRRRSYWRAAPAGS